MAYTENQLTITLPAAADLSASQYCFVNIDTSGRVALSGDDGNCAGILQNKPNALGQAAEVCVYGVSKLVAGGVIRAGYNVGSAADGKGKETDGDSFRNGMIIETSGALNDIVTVLFQKNGQQ